MWGLGGGGAVHLWDHIAEGVGLRVGWEGGGGDCSTCWTTLRLGSGDGGGGGAGALLYKLDHVADGARRRVGGGAGRRASPFG